MTKRTTLADRDIRDKRMRRHVTAVAESILTDHDGDEVFARYLRVTRHVHRYSIRNRMLMHWQAPDSRLIASRTAFAEMAKEQGHEGKTFNSRKGKSWEQHILCRKGSKAVWIWGPPRQRTYSKTVTDPETGEETVEEHHYVRSFPVPIYAVEDILYADTGEPFEAPDFVQPIEHEGLYDALLAFAADQGIDVRDEGLNGARGRSHKGSVSLQKGDPEILRISPLLHELGHELLHDVADRIGSGDGKLLEREAESVAAVVLNYLGHPVSMSASYLRNWGATPKDVLASMGRIADAAGQIVEFIEDRTEVNGDEAANSDEQQSCTLALCC